VTFEEQSFRNFAAREIFKAMMHRENIDNSTASKESIGLSPAAQSKESSNVTI
jgi:hypothetical protein